MKYEKYEFYENKLWYIFWALFFLFWIVISPFIWQSNDVDRVFKFAICWFFCWSLLLLTLSVREIFSPKEAFVIIDDIRITYKEKSVLTLRMLNTGKSRSFLWNDIKSVTLTRPFMSMKKGWKYEKEIRLILGNNQKEWIFTRFLSKKDKDLLLSTIRRYKEVKEDKTLIWG